MTPRHPNVRARGSQEAPCIIGFGAGGVRAARANEPTAGMASGDPRQDNGNPVDQTAGQMVPYLGDATPMELNGNGGGVTDSQHGETENRPAQFLLRHVGAVAAEAARRATFYTVAEWSNAAG